VHVGPVVRSAQGVEGRELEFLVRSMLELKLQVEELRRRMDDETRHPDWKREIQPPLHAPVIAAPIEPPNQPGPPATVTLTAGMKMSEIERAAIESALKETRGNRRKAAQMLDIGERTLYRKLREYGIPVEELN
jgi:DNA-binding NtrC family response regulator